MLALVHGLHASLQHQMTVRLSMTMIRAVTIFSYSAGVNI